ncbi:MAG TPA: cytochrome P450 [Longimicrobiales bacterium]|nr:cytochrome P450 [Longimicrobiales bacterium]
MGNLHQLDKKQLHRFLERWVDQFGPLFRYRMGPKQVVAVADAALSERVLRDRPETYRRASNIEPVFRELGLAGVFSAEGSVWRPQRRLAMHALSLRQLRVFYPRMRTIAMRLEARWRSKAAAGVELDFIDELKRFTVDVTTMLVFGYDVNTIEQEDDVIQRKLELVFPTLNRRLFALLPTWRWLRLPADRRVDRALRELRDWLSARIAEARAQLLADPRRAEQPQTFLESMIGLRDDTGEPVSDEVIMGNALTMLLAGEDTTAYTLAWAVHHLCDAPAAVAALRAESHALLGPDTVPAELELADRLTYAGAVANEALRLRPVAPFQLYEANHDAVIGDVAVPQGTWVALLSRPPVLDEKNFSDPSEFRPERWLDGQSSGAHEAGAHMPFGSGPRICPGRSLALIEMRVVLALLYKGFDVQRTGGAAEVGEQFAFTMSPTALRLRLRSRH